MMHINTLVTTAVTVQHRLGGSSTHWVILMEQMQCMVAKFAGSFSRSSELGAISAPCRRPALWRRRQFPQKPSQSWSTPPQIWAVSQPFCPPRENATQPGFPIFLRPTTMGNKSEESTCRLFQRRCWAPSSFFATRPPWCEPAAGAAGRLTRPAPSHRTCAWPSVAWSRCAARVALFSGGADGSYQVPSAATSGHSEPAEQGELLLIRVGQAAVRQLVATGRGRV